MNNPYFSLGARCRAACTSLLLSAIIWLNPTAQAQYQGVRFDDQDISGFDFSGMNLEGARFGAVTAMNDVDFTDANIDGAHFTLAVAKGFTEQMLRSTKNFKEGSVYAALYYNDLSGWDLSNLDLRGSVFTIMHSMENTDLSNSDIRHGYFQSAHAAKITPGQIYATKSYKEKDLSGITMSASQLSDEDGSVVWDFSGQNLTGADFWACVFASKDGTKRASFDGAVVKGANFGAAASWNYNNCSLQFDQIKETLSYRQKDLSNIILSDNDLRGWEFAGQNLQGASFSNSNLSGVDFTDAIITDANFYWGYDNNRYWNSNDGGLSYEQLISTKSYKEKNLGAINLGGWWGYHATMRNTRRDLSGWNLSGQNLEGAVFANANVRQTNFDNAIITGADFSSTFDSVIGVGSVRNTTDTLTAAQLYSTASYKNRNLEGISFDGISLENWDLSGQNLTNADLDTTDMRGTNLIDAIITGASMSNITKYGFTREQLYSTGSYKNGNLQGVRLSSNDLTSYNFAGQNLINASFYLSTLTDADFTNADVRGAIFESVKDNSFTKEQLYSTASYKNRNMAGINLRNVDLNGWDFTGQEMQNAHIGYMSLAGANFTNTDLRGATTTSTTNLNQATIRNTIWSDGVVKNVVLESGGDYIAVKNYKPHAGSAFTVENPYVITTKISDADVVMSGGRIIIETGAPLALVQHKSLTVAGGSIDMIFGDEGFGVIDVYTGSEFCLTTDTNYSIDFGLHAASEIEYLMVDATHGGIITGDADWINYTVIIGGQDVSDSWEFAIADNGNLVLRLMVQPIPEPASGIMVLIGLAALAASRRTA